MSDGRVKKQYHKSRHNKSKHYLEAGQKGFFCTCNFREKDCVKEAYNLLNEYGDKLYGSTKGSKPEDAKDVDAGGDASESTDISDQLKQELEELKNCAKTDLKEKRFQAVDTGAANCVFIRTNLPNPEEVTNEIFKDLFESKQQKTRYLLRILPIMATCKANLLDISESAGKLFDEYLLKEPSTFSIIFNKRYHSKLSRDEVIESLASMVTMKNSGNKADLKHPQLAIIVEIIKGICLLSIVKNYYEYKKYNLFEICKKEEDKSEVKNGAEKPGEAEPNNADLAEKERELLDETAKKENASEKTKEVGVKEKEEEEGGGGDTK